MQQETNKDGRLIQNGLKVLSLYDGMACAALACIEADLPIEKYIAYEIDKYAVKTSSHNFPFIEHKGDVFSADYSDIGEIDILMGGSPCTFWSVCQKQNRETEASGMGWELFSQYVRALHEVKPKYFVYENNKSMSNAIRESITNTFGFDEICINSALLSAQHRQRLYWVGKRNEDGTYSKVNVEQPKDKGILLADVLDGVSDRDKGRTMLASIGRTTPREYFYKHQNTLAAEPVNVVDDGKSFALKSTYYKSATANFLNGGGHYPATGVDSTSSTTPVAYIEPVNNTGIAEPARIGTYPNNAKNQEHDSQQYRIYDVAAKSVTLCGNGGGMGAKTGLYALSCDPIYVGELPGHNGKYRNGNQASQQYRVYSEEGKAVCVDRDSRKWYAIATEFENGIPKRAISGADGKTYDVYKVEDEKITIKDKSYPIKLVDGYYIIRKLTVSECKRLQTVPEWYEFPVSDTQAYKMLGNGWTVSVIAHLLNAIRKDSTKG